MLVGEGQAIQQSGKQQFLTNPITKELDKMAKATYIPEVTEVTVPEKFTLELTRDEAMALRTVCRRVGGRPDRSPRGHIDHIDNALRDAGAGTLKDDVRDVLLSGTVYFADDKGTFPG